MSRPQRRVQEEDHLVTQEENEEALGYNLDEFIVGILREKDLESKEERTEQSLYYMIDERSSGLYSDAVEAEYRETRSLRVAALRRRYVEQTPSHVLAMRTVSLEELERLPLFEDEKRHVCSMHTCSSILSFKKGERYADLYRPTSTHVASGDVYVCGDTGASHVCGRYRCKRGEAIPRSEGVSCPISGLVVGQVVRSAEYTPYGATRPIPAKPGKDEYNSKRTASDDRFYEEEGKGSAILELEKDDSLSRFKASAAVNTTWDFDQGIAGYRSVGGGGGGGGSSSSGGGSRCARVTRTTEKGSVYETEGVEYFIPSLKGREGVGKRRRFAGLEPAETRLSKRRRFTNVKNSIFEQKRREKANVRTYSEIKQIVEDFLRSNRIEMLKTKIVPREKEVYQRLVRASKHKRLLTAKDLIDAHLCHAMPTYRKMLAIAASPDMSTSMIDYYTNCLFHLWVIMNESDYAKNLSNNVNFAECIVALLYMLRKGFLVPITIDSDSNVRVKTLKADGDGASASSSPAEAEAPTVNGFMEFISPHPHLAHYLPFQNDIRRVEMKRFRQHSVRTEIQYYANVSPMKGQKEIHKCYLNLFLRSRDSVQKLKELEKFALYTRVDIRNSE